MVNIVKAKPRIGIVCVKGNLPRYTWEYLFDQSDVHTVYGLDQIKSGHVKWDLILFPGGPDVPPKMYGEETNRGTWPDEDRTEKEVEIYKAAKENGIPVTGICYGCQLLNVLNGGKMIQDVNGHAGRDHEATDGKNKFVVTSTHHQLMVPGDDAIVVAWANIVEEKDPEALVWPKTGDFGVQFHPEYSRVKNDMMTVWYKSFVKKQTGLEV